VKCIICGKEIKDKDYVQCPDCKNYMHKSCIDEEVLMDVTGEYLCPICAARAALDWLDNIISLYASSMKGEDRKEIIERLKTYIRLLEEA